jgi:hypothetical protein
MEREHRKIVEGLTLLVKRILIETEEGISDSDKPDNYRIDRGIGGLRYSKKIITEIVKPLSYFPGDSLRGLLSSHKNIYDHFRIIAQGIEDYPEESYKNLGELSIH